MRFFLLYTYLKLFILNKYKLDGYNNKKKSK